jgi:hypothetical protein
VVSNTFEGLRRPPWFYDRLYWGARNTLQRTFLDPFVSFEEPLWAATASGGSRLDYLRFQLALREVSRIECEDEVCSSFLGTGTRSVLRDALRWVTLRKIARSLTERFEYVSIIQLWNYIDSVGALGAKSMNAAHPHGRTVCARRRA